MIIDGKEVYRAIKGIYGNETKPITGFIFEDGSIKLNVWEMVNGDLDSQSKRSISLSKESMSEIVDKWLQLEEDKLRSKKWIFKKLLSRNR